jgi:Fe-S-cluster containining protein
VPDARAATAELLELYERVEADLAARPALFCQKSGRCCRFREAGHELYLTRLEYGEMAGRGGRRAETEEGVCPWLEEGLCANREGRALACRTFFCSDEAQAAEVTERWHAEIRRIHERHDIPYDYGALTHHLNFREENTSEGMKR